MLLTPDDLRPYVPHWVDNKPDACIRAIRAAEAHAARWLGWPAEPGAAPTLEAVARVRYLDGPRDGDAAELQLPVAPVSAITTVHQSYNETWDATSLVSSDDYALIGPAGRVRVVFDSGVRWYTGRRVIRVAYTAGYTPESIPDDLADGIARLAAHVMTVGRGGRKESASRAGGSATYRSRRVPSDVRQAWALHRQPGSHGVWLGSA